MPGQPHTSLAALTLGLLATLSSAPAAQYCVAPHGRDENPGTADQPFRTIQRAADVVRAGDLCLVRGGTYRETVRLEASGTKAQPIRFLAYPGETVVLKGTEPIRGPWTVHEGRVFKTDAGQPIRQLFVDGEPMTEARWPNMPFARRWDKARWRASAKGTRYGLMIDPGLATTGIDWTGAVATLNIGSWQTFRRMVRSHGAGRDRFTYDRDERSRLAKGKPHRPGFDRYFLAGKLEALDSPGEWFRDATTRTLYLWTPDGKSPAEHTVEGKTRGYAFAASGVSHVELSGFHFFATTFKLEDVSSCRLDNVHLLFPHGLHDPFGPPVRGPRAPEEPRRWNSRQWFRETSVVTPTYLGGQHNTLANASIRYANGSSLVLVGTKNTVENCLIHDIDWYGLDTGLGVDMLGSTFSAIRSCTIFNLGSSEGIRLSNRGATVVEHNYIHDGGMAQSDGALVQAGTPGIAGTVVRYNWVHDHNAFNWGGSGIRGDDRTRGLIVHHNVAWNCREKGIITKGDQNRILNNTCLDNPAIDICVPRTRLPGKTRELEVQNTHTETVNNCAADISGYYPWQRRGRRGKSGPPLGKLAANYTGQQPLLVDPKRRDFRPRAGSPLIDAGQAIPGITDGHHGKAPDVGAYEHGADRWVPGYRNLLWLLPDPRGLRVCLAMPPLEPVTVAVAAIGSGATVSPARLLFTPDNWTRPQRLAAAGAALRFVIEKVQFDRTIELGKLDPLYGAKLTFRSIP